MNRFTVIALMTSFLLPSFRVEAIASSNNWTQVTNTAPWGGRWGHAAVVFNDQMWVLGGFDGRNYNDVWASTNGLDWTQVTNEARWSARRGHAAVVLNGRMWVLGGFDGSFRNDVWASTNGLDWTQVTNAAPWSGRRAHAAVVLNDQMWVLGGFDVSYRNDVWSSSDGTNWTEVTPAAPWSGRWSHAAVVLNDQMWVLGGYDGNNFNDVWASTNGLDWTEVATGASSNIQPVITAGPTVTNSVLQVGNGAVVVAGATNVFSVEAVDLGGNPLSYQWVFGDGTTNDWSSSNTTEHAYTTNCGPYDGSVTISNGVTTVTSNFTVTVACQLNILKVQTKLNFAKPNADQATVSGAFDLPADYSFAGKPVTLDIGGAEVSFALDSKGGGVNGFNKFSKAKYNAKTGLWTFKAKLKNGSWQTAWAEHSMINSNIPKPGVLVPDLPVILLVDTSAFIGTTNLHYTATQNKSGTAK